MKRTLSLRAWKMLCIAALTAAMLLLPGLSGGRSALTAQAAPAAVNNSAYTVSVQSGYLALRNAMAYDSSNEIGRLYNGQMVILLSTTGTSYWYVYAPTLSQYGYVNADYLVSSGTGVYTGNATGNYAVSVQSGYLALRNAMAYDYNNEIGKLYNGDYVQFISSGDGTYWYVYAPSLGKYGYVNSNYLYATSSVYTVSGSAYCVSVQSGYLALRSAMAYDYNNEIGKLYSGTIIYVQNTSTGNSDYWYVYAPTLGKYGYVNNNYLYAISQYGTISGTPYTVSVDSGYLALRSAMAYDYSNEIGKLYSGTTVYVLSTSTGNSDYWYVYAPSLDKYGYVNRNYLY